MNTGQGLFKNRRYHIVFTVLRVAAVTIAITLVITLMPGVNFANPSLIVFITAGAVLALLNAVLRPIIVMLTGRLLITTMGLFVIVVNFFIFWVIYELFPNQILIDQPVLLRLLIASILITVVDTFLETILGLNQPSVNISGQGQGIWKLVDRLPTGRRSQLLENIRLQQVYETLMNYGLNIAVGGTAFAGIGAWVRSNLLGDRPPIDDLSTPARVRIMLQQLGPTWVKIGQIASSQAGSMPKDWADELAKLQNTVAPFPFEEAKKIIEDELGKPVEELFQSIEEKPLAAASTAQVHRAWLHDGRKVVVKVQRPNIVKQTQADLGVIQSVAQVLDKRIEATRAFDLPGTVHEFAGGVMRELDYSVEMYNAQRLADVVRGIDNIRIVGVHPEYSAERVLTMDLVDGVKVTNTQALKDAGVDLTQVASAYVKALTTQVMFAGFFHGDPHPGNLYVSPATGMLTMLDCGLVGELTTTQRLSLMELIYAIQKKDVDELAGVVLTFCTPTRRADYAAYDRGVRQIIYKNVVYSPYVNLSGFMAELFSSLYDYGFKMNSNISLAIKAITQAMEAASTLDPNLDLLSVINTEAQKQLRTQFTPEKVRETIEKEALSIGREFVRRAPELKSGAFKWVENISAGGVKVQVDTSELSKQVNEIDHVLRRVVIGLVIGSLIIGTGIMAVGFSLTTILSIYVLNNTPTLTSLARGLSTFVPGVALAAFVVIALFSLVLVWRVARPPKVED
jgi:ubiquinone biosynthesis protein